MPSGSWRDLPDTESSCVFHLAGFDAGSFDAYLAVPKNPNGCGIVILQEIFGVNQNIRRYCDLFAQHGYHAAAPDLFWRIEPGLELARDQADLAKAFDCLHRFDEAKGLDDVRACVGGLRGRGMKKVGAVGFCLGGKLAPLSSVRNDVDAAVAFYGVGLEKNLAELRLLSGPVQMHFGGKDDHTPKEVVSAIAEATSSLPNVEIHVYPDAGHAFFRSDLKDVDSSAAFGRVLPFLKQSLS